VQSTDDLSKQINKHIFNNILCLSSVNKSYSRISLAAWKREEPHLQVPVYDWWRLFVHVLHSTAWLVKDLQHCVTWHGPFLLHLLHKINQLACRKQRAEVNVNTGNRRQCQKVRRTEWNVLSQTRVSLSFIKNRDISLNAHQRSVTETKLCYRGVKLNRD